MQYYAGSKDKVPETVKAQIRANPSLQASWRRVYATHVLRKRAENYLEWPFSIPREIMDMILGDECLGIREHIALAATCPALRRLYHNSDIWSIICECRTVPMNGQQRSLELNKIGPLPAPALRKLATAPQKKKANGPYFKELTDPYSMHNKALWKSRHHVCAVSFLVRNMDDEVTPVQRMSAEAALQFYPNLTQAHLDRLRYYEENKRGYPNQWTNAGYAEICVEWMSYRVKAGLA